MDLPQYLAGLGIVLLAMMLPLLCAHFLYRWRLSPRGKGKQATPGLVD